MARMYASQAALARRGPPERGYYPIASTILPT